MKFMGSITGWIIAGAIILGVILIIAMIIGIYNKLVKLRNRVKNSWAQVDVQLKKRFDLVPNLVETVKGYAKHESQLLENITKARASVGSAQTPEQAMAANKELGGALSRLLVVSENYPDLKANTNFTSLQNELSSIENKIAMSRQFYNDIVMKYNEAIQVFPNNIFAGLFKFREEKYFEVEETEKKVVKVSF